MWREWVAHVPYRIPFTPVHWLWSGRPPRVQQCYSRNIEKCPPLIPPNKFPLLSSTLQRKPSNPTPSKEKLGLLSRPLPKERFALSNPGPWKHFWDFRTLPVQENWFLLTLPIQKHLPLSNCAPSMLIFLKCRNCLPCFTVPPLADPSAASTLFSSCLSFPVSAWRFLDLLSVFLYLCLSRQRKALGSKHGIFGWAPNLSCQNTMEPWIDPVKTGLHDLKKKICGSCFLSCNELHDLKNVFRICLEIVFARMVLLHEVVWLQWCSAVKALIWGPRCGSWKLSSVHYDLNKHMIWRSFACQS